MNTRTSTNARTQSRPRWHGPDEYISGLPTRDLLALAEHHDAGAHQAGLDAVRAEAERRADRESADSLAAQVAGYIGLLADDAEHALADEAHAWSHSLRLALAETPAVDGGGEAVAAAVPAPRAAQDTAGRS